MCSPRKPAIRRSWSKATVQELAPETIFNTATVSGGGSAEALASDGGGASGVADVSITKSANAPIVANGETVTYTLNVQNAGPSAAQEVTVNDPLASTSYSEVAVRNDTRELQRVGLLLAGHARGERHGHDHDHGDGDRP